jgi:hypothetical protein
MITRIIDEAWASREQSGSAGTIEGERHNRVFHNGFNEVTVIKEWCDSNLTASKRSSGQNRELQPIAEFIIAPARPRRVRKRAHHFAAQGLISPAHSPEGGTPPPSKLTKSLNFS